MKITHDEIQARLDVEQAQSVSGNVHTSVILEEGDAAWNPASTKDLIYGPATILFSRYADGSVEAWVR